MIIPNYDKDFYIPDLVNGSSKDMTVDGSSSPVTFKYTVPTDECWYIQFASIFILDSGAMGHNVFGSLGSGLTNGIDFNIKRNGVTGLVRNMKDNVDIFKMFFRDTQLGNSNTGFLNDNDFFFGSRDCGEGIRLCDGDEVQFIINDDLTGIDRLEASISLWRPA